jgi:hypothetical protein
VISPGSTLLCATRVHPKVLQAVVRGLFSAEPDLIIASLALAGMVHQILEGELLATSSPGMRKYGIWRNVAVIKPSQAKLTVAVPL